MAGWFRNNILERMWKKWLRPTLWYYPAVTGGTEEKQKNLFQDNFHIRTVHLDIIKVLFIQQLMH